MKVGILDLQGYPAQDAWEYLDCFWSNKQFISLTDQTISVWCRQLGHQTYYAAYYGWGDPLDALPTDLDLIFISAHTYLAPLAYALGRLYRLRRVRTVIGGPHAKAYPEDSLRFFDLVVRECDQSLITDILSGQFPPGSILSSARPYQNIPTIEERLPELRRSAFLKGRPHLGSFIPMLASIGCPYDCNFCVDWSNAYRLLDPEQLAADLQFASRRFPGVKLVFHDPNFGVRFEPLMQAFETVPPSKRNPYGMECSLSLLRPERIARLKETNCVFVLPSIESWSGEYAHKIGPGWTQTFDLKFERLVNEYNELTRQFYYVGTNFIFGLDSDAGDAPFEATKEFMRRAPFVWPVLHIPMPFGGTPFQARLLREGRILEHMPFMFYKIPYLSLLLKNYDPITYYEKMADLFDFSASPELLRRRLKARNPLVAAVYLLVSGTNKRRANLFRQMAQRLRQDRDAMAFQMGESPLLPEFYARIYQRKMGHYAQLLPLDEMTHPILHNGYLPAESG